MSAVHGVMCDTSGCRAVVASPHSHYDALKRAKRQGWSFSDELSVTSKATCGLHQASGDERQAGLAAARARASAGEKTKSESAAGVDQTVDRSILEEG